jgi:hypothetical protein
MCTTLLIGTLHPPPPRIWLINENAIGQQRYRRHLFVTPWLEGWAESATIDGQIKMAMSAFGVTVQFCNRQCRIIDARNVLVVRLSSSALNFRLMK